jgi:hypothetical protein
VNFATSLILSCQRLLRISGEPLAIPGKPWLRAPKLVWSARVQSGDPVCCDVRQRRGERVPQAREIPQLAGVSRLAYIPPRNQLTAVQDVRAVLSVAASARPDVHSVIPGIALREDDCFFSDIPQPLAPRRSKTETLQHPSKIWFSLSSRCSFFAD